MIRIMRDDDRKTPAERQRDNEARCFPHFPNPNPIRRNPTTLAEPPSMPQGQGQGQGQATVEASLKRRGLPVASSQEPRYPARCRTVLRRGAPDPRGSSPEVTVGAGRTNHMSV